MPRLFVYGTLKRGFYNAGFLDKARYLGEFRTAARMPLTVDDFGVPFLHNGGGGRPLQVSGEGYEVDAPLLASLDELEGVPTYYTRRELECVAEDGSIHALQAYVTPGAPPEGSPLLDEYALELHVQRYVPKEERPADHVSRTTSNRSRREQRPDL